MGLPQLQLEKMFTARLQSSGWSNRYEGRILNQQVGPHLHDSPTDLLTSLLTMWPFGKRQRRLCQVIVLCSMTAFTAQPVHFAPPLQNDTLLSNIIWIISEP